MGEKLLIPTAFHIMTNCRFLFIYPHLSLQTSLINFAVSCSLFIPLKMLFSHIDKYAFFFFLLRVALASDSVGNGVDCYWTNNPENANSNPTSFGVLIQLLLNLKEKSCLLVK